MSAFVVEDETINRVIAGLTANTRNDARYIRDTIKDELGLDLAQEADCEKLGNAMFELNCKSVNARYGEGEAAQFRPLDYAFKTELPPNLIQTHKALSCWAYQCMEGDIPETSLLYATMRRVQADIAEHLIRRLPAYESAKWG